MSNAIENQYKIKDIRQRMLNHVITYDQAKVEAQPIIDDINAHAKQISKKYKVSAGKISFAALMR